MTNLNLALIDSLVEMFLLVIVYLKHAAADGGVRRNDLWPFIVPHLPKFF